jgi:diacylglycerol kinase family enzyme
MLPWVRDLRSQEIEIYTAEPLAINTDGEITTHTPAKFHVVSKALSVIVPTESDAHDIAVATSVRMLNN